MKLQQLPNALSGLAMMALLLLAPAILPAQDHAGLHQTPHDARDHATDHAAHGAGRASTEAPGLTAADFAAGRMIYEMSCTHCHGSSGRGDGGAAIYLGPYSHPRPNNLTAATFKFRSTASGEPPLLSDLMRTIRDGIPGFMPAYRSLGEQGIRQVAAYIASEFIPVALATESTITYLDYPGPAALTADSIRRGEALYRTLGCAACHGADGRETSLHMMDQRGLMVMPMDLSRPDMFGNGSSPEAIYRTLMTGLDGTPMPGYAGTFAGREHELWDLVHYLMSLESP